MTPTSKARNCATRSGRWTTHETDQLLSRYAAGEPISTIAAGLGRVEAAVTNRLHHLRLQRDPRMSDDMRRARPWSAAEDAELDRLLAGGADLEACRIALRRPAGGVSMRVRKLADTDGLSQDARRHPAASPKNRVIEWTDALDEQLAASWSAGDTLDTISNELGIHPSSVDYRIQALRGTGLRLAPRKPRWTAEQRDRLARLREDGVSLRQLEVEFGVTRGTITYHLRKIRQEAPPPRGL